MRKVAVVLAAVSVICQRNDPLVAVSMLAFALPTGCRTPAAQETNVRSVLPSALRHSTQPSAIGSDDYAAKARRVPVLLHSRFKPTPLTDGQMDEILDDARQMAPKEKDVWFILLKNNSERDGVLRYNVNVYFTPEFATARLRKGRYIGLGGGIEEIREILRKLFPESEGGDQGARQNDSRIAKERRFERLCGYYQVSQRDEPFGNDLGIPRGTLLPFAAPEGFADDEVVDLVDFIRTNPPGLQRPNAITFPTRFDGTAPIISIKRTGGMIEILCGVSEGMLSGMGEMMQCKKEKGAYKVMALGQWVS